MIFDALFDAFLLLTGAGVLAWRLYLIGYARGRCDATEAHVAAKMVEYGMAAPRDRDGVGWQ